MMTDVTGNHAGTRREPIALDEIKRLHDQTTWPAIQEVKRRRDDLIRAALAHGDLTARQIAEALPVSDQHVGRIRAHQTSGARAYLATPERQAAELRQTAANITASLEELGEDLSIPIPALRKRAAALQARLEEINAQLEQLGE